MVYCINHTRAGSCLLHCWEANFPFPVPPSLFFSGSLSRGWQLSLKGEAGSGNLHNMWVIREQTSSSKCSRKECAAPWKHCLAWEKGIAGINDRQEGQEMRAPGSTCTGPSGRKLRKEAQFISDPPLLPQHPMFTPVHPSLSPGWHSQSKAQKSLQMHSVTLL